MFLALISPPGLEAYFAELAHGLAHIASHEDAAALRADLSTRHDIEVVASSSTGRNRDELGLMHQLGARSEE